MKTEMYQQNLDGTVTYIETIDDGIPELVKEGEVKLVPTSGGARITVNSIYAGQFITLQREQTSTANMGNVTLINVIDGVSFEIRSTNASDAGTIKWKLIEE
jgi:hypothetical protein